MPVPVVVSPKFQLKVNGTTPPVVVAVNCTGVLVVGDAGLNVNVMAVKAGATTTDCGADVAETPLASMAVTVTLKVPAA